MPYPMLEEKQSEEILEDSHVVHFWELLDFEIKKEYDYVPKNFLFQLISHLLYNGIAFPILAILNKVLWGFKIEGKENLEKVKDTGVVTVANHVHYLDCTMIGIGNMPRKTHYTSLESNFKIPVVNVLIRLLNTIPIPTQRENKKEFIKTIDDLLQQGNMVHFYPETALWPYSQKIRKFKKGAFDFAVRNEVPVLPYVITFREPTGIYKIWKKKPCITMKILQPEYGNKNLDKKVAIEDLQNRVQEKMKQVGEENGNTSTKK